MPRQLKKSEEALVVSVRKDESTAKSYGAARNYARRPFGVGNIANLRHGAFAEPVISDVAVQIGEELHERSGCAYTATTSTKSKRRGGNPRRRSA